MQKRLYMLLVYMVCLISSYQLIGSESSFIIDDCSEKLIMNVIDDRCYVKPGSIYISEEGIFLVDGNEMFPIAQLEADKQGVFFRITSDYEVCPTCGKTKVYGKCPNRNCPRYGTQIT